MRPAVAEAIETAEASDRDIRENGLADLVDCNALFPTTPFQSQTIAQPWTFAEGAAYVPFTLNRIALNYGYMTYGLVQDLVDMVVDDAFRGGITLVCDELEEDEVKKLINALEEEGDFEACKQTLKWGRLFGGAGLIAATDQDPKKELADLREGDELKFIAANRWELLLTNVNLNGLQITPALWASMQTDLPYNYYGVSIHQSRVTRILGKEAPDMVRARLQGWGMSELERCIREINSYIKFQNLLFELVDEAKVDVYSIQNFTTQLASAQGTALVNLRIRMANWLKNYQNALILDKDDTYEQKQIAFSGLADIFQEFRINLCSALGIPYNKLFGQSATGFASGEDSMENYNAMVETSARDKAKPLLREIIKLRMMTLFGFAPEFTFEFKPLRVLTKTEEETVNGQKQTRTLELYDRDLLDGMETMETLHKEGLVTVESAVLEGSREPISPLEMQQQGQEQDGDLAKKKLAIDAKKTSKTNGIERIRGMLQGAVRRRAA